MEALTFPEQDTSRRSPGNLFYDPLLYIINKKYFIQGVYPLSLRDPCNDGVLLKDRHELSPLWRGRGEFTLEHFSGKYRRLPAYRYHIRPPILSYISIDLFLNTRNSSYILCTDNHIYKIRKDAS